MKRFTLGFLIAVLYVCGTVPDTYAQPPFGIPFPTCSISTLNTCIGGSEPGRIAIVIDALDKTDCSVGGGTVTTLCMQEPDRTFTAVAGGGAGGVPGFTAGVITDDTLGYIYQMKKFMALPPYPRFYFSADAGGEMGLGVDTNTCTFEFPCLTIDKMEAIANRGQVHIILDSGDDWFDLTDWGTGNESIVMTDPAACAGIGPDLPCVIFSGSSGTPADRAEITCTNAGHTTTSDGLFVVDFDGSTHGWFGIQNIQVDNCPTGLTYKQSNFVLLSDGAKMVALNWKSLNGMRGSDVATSGENAVLRGVGANTEAVFLNAEVSIEDSGTGYAADLFYGGDGSITVIGRSQIDMLDSDGNNTEAIEVANATGSQGELVTIGHTINYPGASATNRGVYADAGLVAGATIFVADTTLVGFAGANNAAIFATLTADLALDYPLTLFRTTFSGAMATAIRSNMPALATHAITGTCLLAEGFQDLDYYWRMSFGNNRTNLAGVPIVLEGLYDDDPVAASGRYYINANLYTTKAAANASLLKDPATTLSLWEGPSIDAGGVGVDGTPFGTLASQHACQSADCYARCSADKTASHTFLRSGIPAFVLQEQATGIQLGGRISNFGSR